MRLVLKVGSGVLARADGLALDLDEMRRLVGEIAALRRDGGHECVLVSSGAVAAGLMELGLQERPADLPSVQALAAIGQARLMQTYRSLFDEHDLVAAQLLLTHQDLDSRIRYRNASATLEKLLGRPEVVPIINENDSVAVEELKFGDNDELSAEVAILSRAKRLLLLTSVDGLNERADGSGRVLRRVDDVEAVLHLAGSNSGQHSVGGMQSKLRAVGTAVRAGIDTWIANGGTPGVIAALGGEPEAGTWFPSQSPRQE